MYGPRSLPRNPPYCMILEVEVFDNLISFDKLFAKTSLRFATCLLVNKNSCAKLVLSSELPIIFDDNLKTSSVLFFTVDFNLLSCEFDSFNFKLLYWAVLYWWKLSYSMKLYSITHLQNFHGSLWKA